nr:MULTISPECIES: chorismate mutase [unclassified Fusibacter]
MRVILFFQNSDNHRIIRVIETRWKVRDIKKIRDEFDRVDKTLVALLEKRFTLSREIGLVKREAGMLTEDQSRELEVIRNVIANLEDDSLDVHVLSVFETIINESKNVQKEEDN